MPSNIEDKVVSMRFDNSQFDGNIKKSQKSIEELESKLGELGASGLFAPFLNSIETVGHKFSALEEIAVGALRRIGEKVVDTGEKLVKELSIDQIMSGYSKYEEKTSSVQTIMNATGDSIDEVNEYLSQLMWYSDETSYSFTDMTSALGQMTAAGGDVKKLIPLITGLANATAYAGKGNAEFSRSIYNLNQSYTAGFLNYMDWKSFQLAGTATKQLTQELITAGEELGKIEKGSVTVENFAGSLKEKWADTEVMERAFGNFAKFSNEVYKAVQSGEYETASKAMEDLAAGYDEMSVKAFQSAQMAKSFTEAIEATKDAVSSGWMTTFELIFGNIEEAKVLWTDLANTLWDMFASGAEGRNELIGEWMGLDEGGRDDLIESFFNILEGIQNGINTIKDAFREFFPAPTIESLSAFVVKLKEATRAFADMLAPLEESEDGINEYATTAGRVRIVLRGFISIIDLARNVFVGFRDALKLKGGAFDTLIGGVRGVTIAISDMIFSFTSAVNKFVQFDRLFADIGNVVFAIAGVVKEAFNELFGVVVLKNDFSWVGTLASYITYALQDLLSVIENIDVPKYVGLVKKIAGVIRNVLVTVITTVMNLVPKVVSVIKQVFATIIAILPTVRKVVEKVVDTFINLFQKVLAAAPSVISTLAGLLSKVLTLVPGIITAAKSIAKEVGKVIDKFIATLPSIIKSISKVIDALVKAFDKILKKVPSLASALSNMAVQLIGYLPRVINLLPGIISFISQLIDIAMPFVLDMIRNVPKVASIVIDVASRIVAALPTVIDIIKKTIAKLKDFSGTAKEIYESVKKYLLKGIAEMKAVIPSVMASVTKAFTKVQSIIPKLTSGISKSFDFVKTLFAGFDKNVPAITEKLKSLFVGIDWKSVLEALATPISLVVLAFEKLKEAIEAIDISKITEKFSKLGNTIKNTVTESFEKVISKVPSFSKAMDDASVSTKKFIDKAKEKIDISPITFFKNAVELVAKAIKTAHDNFSDFKEFVSDGFTKLGEILKNSWFYTALIAIKDFFVKLGGVVKKAFGEIWSEVENNPLEALVTVIKFLLDGGLIYALTRFTTSLSVVPKTIGEILEQLKDSVQIFSAESMARSMKLVSTSMIELAAALLILSFVDAVKVGAATIALGALFAELAVSMNKLLMIKPDNELKIGAIMMELAASVLILSLAFKMLADIDSEGIINGVAAITTMVGELTLASTILTKKVGEKQLDKATIVAFATGILLLSKAFTKVAEVEDLHTAVMGFSTIMTEMLIAMIVLSNSEENILKASASAILLGISYNVLIPVIRKLGEMDPATLLVGVIAFGVIVFEMCSSMKKLSDSSESIAKAGVAAVLMAIAIGAIIPAIRKLGGMPLGDLVQGTLALGVILVELVLALDLLSANQGGLITASIAAIIMGAAIEIIIDALKKLNELSGGELFKTILAFTVILAEITAALLVLSAVGPMSLVGAGALLIVAAAMKVLGDALIKVSKVPFKDLMVGLAGLAISIVAITALAVLLAPATIALGALAGALAVLGIAILALSVGALKFTTAFAAIATVGAAGAGVLTAALTAVMVSLLAVVPLINKLISELIVGIIETITTNIPLIVNMILEGIANLIDGIIEYGPRIIGGILQILVDLLAELAKKIPEIGEQLTLIVGGVILGLLNGIVKLIPDFIQAGWDLMISFIEGMADGIENNFDRLIEAMKHLGEACIEALKKLFPKSTKAISDAVHELADNGIVKVIKSKWKDLKDAMKALLEKAIDAIKDMWSKFKESGQELIDKIKEGITEKWESFKKFFADKFDELKNKVKEKVGEWKEIGNNIVDGLKDGITEKATQAKNGIVKFGTNIGDWFCDTLGIESPSKVFRSFGMYIDEGLAKGINDYSGLAEDSTKRLGNSVADTMSDTLSLIAEAASADMDVNPTITPVLDLSELNAGKKLIDGMWDGASINLTSARLNATAAISASGNSITTNGSNGELGSSNISFVQNNYSPKSLSAIDIYRQTRNQFSAMKRVIAHD